MVAAGVEVRGLPPHHGGDQPGGGDVVTCVGGDVAAVAEDRDPVRDGEHLLQAVADEQDGDALVPQLADLPEQALDLVGRQRSRGLVHDQHPDVERDGLGDFDRLLSRHGQAHRRHAGVEVDVEARQQGLGVRAHLPPAHDTPQVTVADEDVLGHAEIREDQRLLVDGGDAQPLGVGRVPRRRGRAVDQDLALVRLVDAGHDLDQRRLAGPVLADQRMHLAPPQLERHVVEGTGAPEPLGDAPHGEHDIVRIDHPQPPDLATFDCVVSNMNEHNRTRRPSRARCCRSPTTERPGGGASGRVGLLMVCAMVVQVSSVSTSWAGDRREAPGEMPTVRLKARLNAASDS